MKNIVQSDTPQMTIWRMFITLSLELLLPDPLRIASRTKSGSLTTVKQASLDALVKGKIICSCRKLYNFTRFSGLLPSHYSDYLSRNGAQRASLKA